MKQRAEAIQYLNKRVEMILAAPCEDDQDFLLNSSLDGDGIMGDYPGVTISTGLDAAILLIDACSLGRSTKRQKLEVLKQVRTTIENVDLSRPNYTEAAITDAIKYLCDDYGFGDYLLRQNISIDLVCLETGETGIYYIGNHIVVIGTPSQSFVFPKTAEEDIYFMAGLAFCVLLTEDAEAAPASFTEMILNLGIKIPEEVQGRNAFASFFAKTILARKHPDEYEQRDAAKICATYFEKLVSVV